LSKNSVIGTSTKVLSALGLNAIPAVGFFGLGWGWENTILIYLLETLLGILLAVLRIRLLAPAREEVIGATLPEPLAEISTERRSSKKVIRYAWPTPNGVLYDRTEMLKSYLVVTLGLSAGTAVFLLVFLFLIMRVQIDPAILRTGLLGILVFQLLNLLGDVVWLRALSLDQAEKLLNQSMGRVALLYLAVFAGVCAAPFHADGFLLPFIGLKTMVDIGQPIQALYQRWSHK
jgi:hypothetical protein